MSPTPSLLQQSVALLPLIGPLSCLKKVLEVSWKLHQVTQLSFSENTEIHRLKSNSFLQKHFTPLINLTQVCVTYGRWVDVAIAMGAILLQRFLPIGVPLTTLAAGSLILRQVAHLSSFLIKKAYTDSLPQNELRNGYGDVAFLPLLVPETSAPC